MDKQNFQQKYLKYKAKYLNLKNKQTGGASLKNTKNKLCTKNSNCCPHMHPTGNKYAPTSTKHVLKYKGSSYKLKTCCKACGDSMQEMAKKHPKKFSKKYIKKIDDKGNIHAKNQHTGKVVQILKKIIN